jgi:group II intron reverse transcriptase/maturase
MYKGKYVNLIEVVADVDFLQGAYQRINSNPVVMAKRSSDETLDGFDSKWFKSTYERLLNGSFWFKPARRLMIPKSNKSGLRLLTISDSRDKIVQQAMKMVLERVYEPLFLDISHGYRPSRGCHSALESIRINWTGISWFLEFDVEKCYDNIDRHRLISILKEEIDDQRFINLIFKLFNAGIIGWKEGLGPDPSEGVAQGSVVSPILANIYLHKLDVEVASITKGYQKGKIRRKNTEAVNAERRIYRRKEFKSLPPEKQAAIISKHRAERRKMGVTMTDWNDPDFVRVRYVRYADDVLMGIAGPKDLVKKIRDRVMAFTMLNLKLTLTGGEITHIEAGKVKFLGMWISAVPHSKFSRRFGKVLEKKKRVKNRLLLQKQIKKERVLKIVRRVLIKALGDEHPRKIDSLVVGHKVDILKQKIAELPESSLEWSGTYRKFLKALSSNLFYVPVHLKKDLVALEAKIADWEKTLMEGNPDPKKRYKEVVGRYDALPPQIEAPLEEIRSKLRQRGLISKSNKPIAVGRFIYVPDDLIVKWYTQAGRGLLNYYRCCRNFYKVKSYVDYMVRWSAIHTLAGKHKSSSRRIIAKHTLDLIIKDQDGLVIAQFLSSQEIKGMGRKFLSNVSKDAGDKVLETDLG